MGINDINKEHSEIPVPQSQDLVVARFRTYAKEHFQDAVRKDIDYLQYIKNCGLLQSFKLAEEKSEVFIYYDAAPYFWLCDIPAVQKMEEWVKNEIKGRISSVEGYKAIKDFFSKWVILKSEQEKKYYALSTVKLIEREVNPNNVLKVILHAVILTYDRKLYSPDKAIELLSSAQVTLQQSKVSEQIKKSLGYIICVFSAFAYLKKFAYLEANHELTQALEFNPFGITAKFYLALVNKKMGDKDTSIMLLNELVSYDKETIQYAIENNNVALLAYYLQNAVTYNIFTEYEFADMLEDIEAIIGSTKGLDSLNYDQLGAMVIKLHDLYLQDYYTEEITKSIEFLERVNQSLIGNQNTVVAFSQPFLREKLDKVVELILASIRKRYSDEINEKLFQYDLGIEENEETIRHLAKESEEVRKLYKKRLDEALSDLENIVTENIAAVEYKISNIHEDKKLNPQIAFNNSMVYNIIVTLLVFIVGGFVGCYGGTIGDVYSFKDVMSAVMVSGLKWSAITFLLGIIIAMCTAAFTYVERINEKQRLLKKITYLKAYKEKEIDVIKKDNETKLKNFLGNLNERIEAHKRNCDSLRNEKQEQLAALQEGVDKKINEHQEKLNTVFT